MSVRPALSALLLASLAPLSGQTVPEAKIDLLADPALEGWVFHLNEKNSLSTKREEVATIKDGTLHVTGKGMGYLRTGESFRDYHLVAEYKWGERTWSKREDRARDCGLLLHCHGPDGVFGGTWPACVQTQMLEGSMGDINVLQGKDAPTNITVEVEKDAKGKTRWKKGGEAATFPLPGKSSASIVCKTRDPEWKDVKGFRGKDDVDKPAGEWNRLEVICDGGIYRIFLNGVLVNEGRDATPDEGFIGIQSEWA
ncbi:MAG: DUF1080 domain-containing protein, partial [Akkermansiaceae bacterium]|nr:DUF1080 domain-containing protein [Akkermansiaceae bacterium]